RRHLRRHFRDVARDLVHAGRAAVASRDHSDLVHVRQRARQGLHDLGQSGYQFVYDRGLVVLLVGLGFHVHGASFGIALLEDDFGFGFALRANGAGAAFGFHHSALALRLGERLNALPVDLRLLQYGGNQFFFAAQDLGFLHLDLLLFLHLLHLNGLGGNLLLHHVGLDFVGLVGLRLLALDHFYVCRFLHFEIALRLRLAGLRCRLGGHAFLVG